MCGELSLMLAVLEDGIDTLLKHAQATRGQSGRLRRESLQWLTTADRGYAFGFERLCEALEIDPRRLRRRILAEVRRRGPDVTNVSELRASSDARDARRFA